MLCGLETARDSADLIGNRISVYLYLYVPRLRKKMNYVLEEDQVMMRLTNIIGTSTIAERIVVHEYKVLNKVSYRLHFSIFLPTVRLRSCLDDLVFLH